MRRVEIKRQMNDDDLAAIGRLLDEVADADGRRPLSDHLYLDLVNGGDDRFAGFLVRVADEPDLVAYAQVSHANDSSVFEMAIHPVRRDETLAIGTDLIDAAIGVIGSDGGGQINWWVHEPTSVDRQLAADAGLRAGRTLHQMRRPLPTGLPVTVETRDFVPGADDADWLAVNNRAFADHGEQGGWTLDTFCQRQGEAWFDPAGFRIHEIDGRMAAFCWTKVHPSADVDSGAEVGEIYVIAVDPDFHGRGLGKQLTLAGLEHLSNAGIDTALLYVDADNLAAVTMYERLGFAVAATDVAFQTEIAPSGSLTPGRTTPDHRENVTP